MKKFDLHGEVEIFLNSLIKLVSFICSTELKDGVEFELVGDLSKLEATKPEEEENGHKNGKNGGKYR